MSVKALNLLRARIEARAGLLTWALGGTAFWTFGGFWSFKLWLWAHAPRAPNPTIGAEIAVQSNGGTFYVTHWQDLLLTALFWLSIGAFLCAAVIDYHFDPFTRRRK